MGKLIFQAIEFGRGATWAVGERCLLSFSHRGNLELWRTADLHLLWESSTENLGVKFAMQSDGNMVIYDKDGKGVWASGTFGNNGAMLAAQDDGKLIIYSADQSKPLWEAGSAQHVTSK